MTDQQPHWDEPTIRERLTATADGLRHFREIFDRREKQIDDAIWGLMEHNRKQDRDLETMEERLQHKIGEIYALLWSGMKWGGGLLASTILAIVLKALQLI